jgi:hypothetical protein
MRPEGLLALFLVAILAAHTSFVQGEEPSVSAQSDSAPPYARIKNKMWWNDTQKIEALALSDQVREEMDALLIAYAQSNKGLKQEQANVMAALAKALTEGDDVEARRQGEVLGDNLARPMPQQVDMMINVLAKLTPEQHDILVAQYPGVLSRLWLRSPMSKMARYKKTRKPPVE